MSSSFKRDIKRVKAQGKQFPLLNEVVRLLLDENQLPMRYQNHKLTGSYVGYWELHIKPDWLLIYKVVDGFLYLVRTGSHSELF